MDFVRFVLTLFQFSFSDVPLADFDSVEKKAKSEKIMTHLLKMPYRYHTSYALKYLGCEILALLALVCEIFDNGL